MKSISGDEGTIQKVKLAKGHVIAIHLFATLVFMKLETKNLGAKATTIPFGPSLIIFLICIPNMFFKFEVGI
jgi:hypothetical protein